jgi:hypothetical protein
MEDTALDRHCEIENPASIIIAIPVANIGFTCLAVSVQTPLRNLGSKNSVNVAKSDGISIVLRLD